MSGCSPACAVSGRAALIRSPLRGAKLLAVSFLRDVVRPDCLSPIVYYNSTAPDFPAQSSAASVMGLYDCLAACFCPHWPSDPPGTTPAPAGDQNPAAAGATSTAGAATSAAAAAAAALGAARLTTGTGSATRQTTRETAVTAAEEGTADAAAPDQPSAGRSQIVHHQPLREGDGNIVLEQFEEA